MPIERVAVSLTAAALAIFCGTTVAIAQTTVTIPPSSTSSPADAGQRVHTNVQFITVPLTAPQPQFGGPPVPGYFFEDPASLACVYSLVVYESAFTGCNPNSNLRNPSGGSKAIAVVDAYDDPDAPTDLQSFSAQFGVFFDPSKFQVVYAPAGGQTPGSCTGSATRPPTDPTGGWEIEESLDIEYAHSMAPGAMLYLVEAQSDALGDLLCAVTTASNLVVKTAGGGEVNMSWGTPEFAQETSVDPVFTTPGIVYFASTGDLPGIEYPAASPNVVSAGGASIDRNPATGAFITESTWQLGGGGPSAYEPRPGYQKSVQSIVGNSRGTPDLSLDANPYTGAWVLDNFQPPSACNGGPCWYIVGGTSLASVTTAAIVNVSGNFAASSNAELTGIYAEPSSAFTNIHIGSCGPYMGYLATSGWDFCTGLGSPNGYISPRP